MRILLVEDDQRSPARSGAACAQEGFAVDVAPTGRRAVARPEGRYDGSCSTSCCPA